MFTYSQRTGILQRDGVMIASGCYSGHGEGRNNPDMQAVRNEGPIPRGDYTLKLIAHAHLTAPVFQLIPDAENEMFGRDEFLLHGDNVENDASHGCIIARHVVRVAIQLSGDTRLRVTE